MTAIVAASVKILWQPPGQQAMGGSGVAVWSDVARNRTGIITCKHVTPFDPENKRRGFHISGPIAPMGGGTSILITFPSGDKHYASWVASDAACDLAAIEIAGVLPTVPIAMSVENGADVTQIGYPLGKGPSYRQGKTVGVQGRQPSGGSNYVLAFAVQSGDSGSGFFTGKGELAGIVWGTEIGNPRSVATGVDDVRRFAERCWPGVCRPRRPAAPAKPVVPPPELIPGKPPPPDGGLQGMDSRLQRIEEGLAVLQSRQGTPGPAGPQGPAGPPGPAGKDGTSPPAVRVRIVPRG